MIVKQKHLQGWLIASIFVGVGKYLFNQCKILMNLPTTIPETLLTSVIPLCTLMVGLILVSNYQENVMRKWGGWLFVALSCLGFASRAYTLIDLMTATEIRSVLISVCIASVRGSIEVLAYILIALSYKNREMRSWGILYACFEALFVLGGWKYFINGPENMFLYVGVVPFCGIVCRTIYYVQWIKAIGYEKIETAIQR